MLELQDPVFGSLNYAQGIWTFLPKEPTDGVLIGVYAPEAGPSGQQRSLFSRVRAELPQFESLARDYIASCAEPSVPVDQLSTYSVQIGDDDATQREEFVLELSDEDAYVVHRVSFKAGRPVNCGFDD